MFDKNRKTFFSVRKSRKTQCHVPIGSHACWGTAIRPSAKKINTQSKKVSTPHKTNLPYQKRFKDK